jgi:hypothetical protein
VVDLPYEVSVEQLLDFFTDEILPLNRLLLGFRLDRSGVRVDLQMVLDHLPRCPRHPKEQGFVLHHVVGHFKVQVHHVLELVFMWGKEQYPRTGPYLRKEPSKK